jgi:transposase
MREVSTFVGLDAHKDTIVVAMLMPGSQTAIEWKIVNEPGAVRRFAKKLQREAVGEVRCCYEAGPCGYVLQRQLAAADIACAVVAPSLIPVKPGQPIKTDRRDARKLAELLRAGLLTEVHAPSEDEEAVRDLTRARDDAQRDLTRAKNRLSKFLLRRGCVYCVGRRPTWSAKYRRWLHGLVFERAAGRIVFEDYVLAFEQTEARLEALDAQLVEMSTTEPYRARVAALRCFHGIDTVTALALVAELHTPERFPSPRQLAAYLGLVPREASSGGRRRLGGITGAGNRHVRRLLVESAWHYRHKPQIGRALRLRRRGQPPAVVALADRALRRLTLRQRRMTYQGKHPNAVTVAIARELAGHLWNALRAAVPVGAGTLGT